VTGFLDFMTFNLKIGVFIDVLRFPAATHILRVNCAEMAGNGPGQPALTFLA